MSLCFVAGCGSPPPSSVNEDEMGISLTIVPPEGSGTEVPFFLAGPGQFTFEKDGYRTTVGLGYLDEAGSSPAVAPLDWLPLVFRDPGTTGGMLSLCFRTRIPDPADRVPSDILGVEEFQGVGVLRTIPNVFKADDPFLVYLSSPIEIWTYEPRIGGTLYLQSEDLNGIAMINLPEALEQGYVKRIPDTLLDLLPELDETGSDGIDRRGLRARREIIIG